MKRAGRAAEEAMGERRHTIEAEIFAVGTWNGDTYTRADLEEIARNFEALKDLHRPPLKLGHDEKQVLAQEQGQPALGWVGALQVRGDKLVATLSDLPQIVHEAIRAGRYRRVSAELWLGVKRGGKTLGRALKAVALLGADLPAVTTLEDLTAYLAQHGGGTIESTNTAAYVLPAGAQPDKGDGGPALRSGPAEETHTQARDAMSDDTVKLSAQVAELTTRLYAQETRAHAAEVERDRLKAEQERVRVASHRAALEGELEAGVKAGKLTPAQREQAVKLFALREDARALQVTVADLHAFIEAAAPGGPPKGRQGLGSGGAGADGDKSGAASEIVAKAYKLMAERDISFSAASQIVLRAELGLARDYRDHTAEISNQRGAR